MNSESNPNNITVTVTHEDGSTESIKVRQLPLGFWDFAMNLLTDEIALTAYLCVPAGDDPKSPKPFNKNWALTLHPASYEELALKAKEVNTPGFFSYAARRLEAQRNEQTEYIRAMADLPPEAIKTFAEMGKNSASPTSAPRPRSVPR